MAKVAPEEQSTLSQYRRSSDLVISMTIAEVFLLLVFVVWYSSTKETSAAGTVGAVQEENKRLRNENAKLQEQNRVLTSELEESRKLLEFWRTRFGQFPPRNEKEVAEFLQDLGRGKPKCQEQNVLIEASVVRGEFGLQLLVDSPELQRLAGADRERFVVGSVLRSENDVDALFRYVRAAEAAGGPNAKGCRFDYRLEDATYKDYYTGRERLEALFYSAARPRRIEVPGLDQ